MKLELFQQYRPLLFSIAYRMLGAVTEAEDVLQDAYLRVRAQPDNSIENPKTYLTTVVTRLCLNHLSAAKVQREEYLGPWLPEPLITDNQPDMVNPAVGILKQESISIAFLVLLEALSPAERAVFLLHDVFDYKFAEIAKMLDKREDACRQLCRRARQHIASNRPRYTSSPEQHERMLRSFIEVVELGEVDAFLQLLAEDITFVPDGGGERGAAIRVLHGREAVASFIFGILKITSQQFRYEVTTLNGQQCVLAHTSDGRPYFVMFIYVQENAVQLIHVIAGRKLVSIASLPPASQGKTAAHP